MKKPVKPAPIKGVKVATIKVVKPDKLQDVEFFIQSSKHTLKPAMIVLRTIILKADKTLTEQIKWNAPSFCHQGDDRITFNLSKKDCLQVIWHRGAKSKDRKGRENLFDDDSGLLEWLSPDRAITRFYSEAEVTKSKATIAKLVKRWIDATKV
jgi:uncharacterized protein YdhG (YjbR/CyaY superfamily)